MKLAEGRSCVSTIMILAIIGVVELLGQDYERDSRPPLFSHDELVQLGSPAPLPSPLAAKLHVLTTTPLVNNEAHIRGIRPRALDVNGMGPTLRVALWNIERGISLDDIVMMLTDKDRFLAKVREAREQAKASGKRIRNIVPEKLADEIDHLSAADVLILNEVDWGVKRSEYREVVRELGERLEMNWAFGVEFVEVAPIQLGTATWDNSVKDVHMREELRDRFNVDKDRVRALHGNAVLSRYPIRSARLVPFKVGYDWFKETGIRPLEKGKRKAAILIGEDLTRETRRGQRTTLYIELDVPQAPAQRLTIVATHLENRTKPRVRRLQMQEVLSEIRDYSHPVILAGDLNTTGADSTPTSVERMLIKRYGSVDFWTTKGVRWATGVGLTYTAAKSARSLSGIQYRVDPTSANVPGASPNLERGLFTLLERFRFVDGQAFDFRGDSDRSANGRSGTLANSNERASRGFVPTFVTELIWGGVRVAKFKLDWIFVKTDSRAPDVFSPHRGRTLENLNNSLPEPLSDHSPMTVDLPFRTRAHSRANAGPN